MFLFRNSSTICMYRAAVREFHRNLIAEVRWVEYSQASELERTMWKARPDENPSTQPKPATAPVSASPAPSNTPAPVNKDLRAPEPPRITDPVRTDVAAHIGKSVVIKGELSGNEDLYLDGEVEGTVDMGSHSLVIGPNARVHANIAARDVVLHGRLEGNVRGLERVELKKSCVVTGDISTQRIVIEDGAFFKGAVDLQKEAKPEQRKA